MTENVPTPPPAVKLRPQPGGVSAPLYGLTLPPSWTPAERVRLALARALHAAAEHLADAACRVAPSWPGGGR